MAAAHGQPAAARRHAAQRGARRGAAGAGARQRRRDGPRQQRHRGGRGGDQAGAGRHRPPADPLRRATASTGSRWARCRSTGTRSSATASAPCSPAATRFRSATSTRSSASSPRATSPPSWSSRSRERASTCRRPGYLPGAQERCRAAGTLFVCDEVQTGLGRTGRFLALEHWGLEPDMICVAKALSGGMVPIGAVLVSRAVLDRSSTAWSVASATAPPSAATTSPRPPGWPPCGCSTTRAWSRAPSGSGRCCWSSPRRWWSAMRSSATFAGWG